MTVTMMVTAINYC